MTRRWPSRPWAVVELLVASVLMAAGLHGSLYFSAVPWMWVAATLLLWWRGPSWRELGLRRPTRPVIILGVIVGIGYQGVGTFVVEPIVARLLTGRLPDVSAIAFAPGDEGQLAIWLGVTWTMAAFMEEMVFRGWLLFRIAELGRFSPLAWNTAVVGSSLWFGMAHAYQGLPGMLATGLTGLVFGVLYVLTGRNLWPVIIAHGVLDTVGFVMIYVGVYPGLSPEAWV